MNYKTLLIDDEINNLENLESAIQKHCSNLKIVGLADNADKGIKLIKEKNPDLIFLDIKMPNKDGFQLLESLDHINFEVVIVTAYNQYALKAIKFCAIDYLLKPVETDELIKAVKMATDRIKQKKENERLKQLLHNIGADKDAMKLGLASQSRIDFVKTDEIIRCEAENNYTNVYLTKGDKRTISKTLKEFEELLIDHGFVRTHQTHLINTMHIKSFIKKDGGYIELSDLSVIPISRSRKEEIITQIKKSIVI